MKTILIVEAIGSLNKGEVAIFWGMHEALKLLGETKIYLCTADAANDAQEYDTAAILIVDNVVRSSGLWGKLFESLWFTLKHLVFILLYKIMDRRVIAVMPGPLWRAYLEADLLIMGHDNLLVGRIPLNLLVVPLVGHVMGKTSIVYAGSVGPFVDRLTPVLARWLLDRVDLVTLREEISLKNVRALGVRNPAVYVTADAAFLMPASPDNRIQDVMIAEGLDPQGKLVGITVTQEMAHRFSIHHFKGPTEGYRAYLQMKARMLDHLIEKYDVDALVLAHSLGPEKRRDDRIANRDLYRWIKNKDRVRVIENAYSAQDLKGLVGRCDLFIGERTHSMIAAASMAVPTIGISSRITASKTMGIIGEMLAQSEWILEVETLSEEILVHKVTQAWERREEIRTDLQRRIPELQRRSLNTAKLIKEILAIQ